MPIIPAFITTLAAAIFWLRINDYLAAKQVISNQLSRKIIHIGTGPIFVLCWLFFPDQPSSRYIAAVIPLLISIQFFLIGIGVIKDKASVDAMSRSGDPREILRGPFFYGIAFVVLTIVFWKDSLIGIIALMVLCGGDGIADIVGRRARSRRLPWSADKSVAGSLGMFFGGLALSFVISSIFNASQAFQFEISAILIKLVLINVCTTLVESIPIKDIDNITVPITSVALGLLLF
jgi:phytol kinase